MIVRIWAGSTMTAMSGMRDPQRGQAMTSSAWTLIGSCAQAFLRASASTCWSFGVSGTEPSSVAFLPYRLASARERRAGWSFQVPLPREENNP